MLLHYVSAGEGRHLTRKRALTRTWLCWHPDFIHRTSSLQNCGRNKCWLWKPMISCYSNPSWLKYALYSTSPCLLKDPLNKTTRIFLMEVYLTLSQKPQSSPQPEKGSCLGKPAHLTTPPQLRAPLPPSRGAEELLWWARHHSREWMLKQRAVCFLGCFCSCSPADRQHSPQPVPQKGEHRLLINSLLLGCRERGA